MAYSYREMRRFCLEMAEGATQDVRAALQAMSRNYEDADSEPEHRIGYFAGCWLCIKYLALPYIVIGLPLMYWLHHDYVPQPTPTGQRIERIFAFAKDGPWYLFRTFAFNKRDTYKSDPGKIVIFEDQQELTPDRYEIDPLGANTWRFIRVKTTDDADPRTSEHKYWAVVK